MTDETIRYTADVIVTTPDGRVLLIERDWPPYEGMWAFPGGHVDAGETSRAAAVRELAEETGVHVTAADLSEIGVWDQPGRDPRGRYVTVVYLAVVPGDTPIVAGDDARTACWWRYDSLPPQLAFDHADILNTAVKSTTARRREVVVLCGSTRFWTEMAEANLRETVAGHIVIAPGCNLKQPHELWADPGQAEQLKQLLDELHRDKIAMADRVLVVNPGGYVGTSTRAEIAYAASLGIPVRYTEKMLTDTDSDHPANVYADAGDLEAEFAALKTEAVGGRGLADSRILALRKAVYLDRAALILTDDHAAGRADAAKTAEAVGLAEDAALELRRFDNAFGTRLGYIPPHSRVFASGASRIYVRQEYRHWRAGDIVPVSQCDHYDNCPTTECAYGEGYFDKPEDRDPDFPIDQGHQDWSGWYSSIRL